MKELILILFILLSYSITFGQWPKPLEIQEVLISDSSQIKSQSDFKLKSNAFYEDEKYIVRSQCHGEFGGTIWFKNKKTGIEYSCRATCPVDVTRLGTKYYVTCSLMHMSGHTYVLEIDDPTTMAVFKKPSPKQTRHLVYEQSTNKGTRVIADSIGVLTIASFAGNKKLFHLMSNFTGQIYISTIVNNHFKIFDSLPDGRLLNFRTRFETTDGHFIMFFNGDPANGYIDGFENKLKIIRYDKLNRKDYDPVLQWQEKDPQKKRYQFLIDSFYNRKFNSSAFLNKVLFTDKKISSDLIYQAIFNGDSTKFVAFVLVEDTLRMRYLRVTDPDAYEADNIIIWGKLLKGKWHYITVSYGVNSVFYAKTREHMQRYLFNRLQELNFFQGNSTELNPLFWNSTNFNYIRVKE